MYIQLGFQNFVVASYAALNLLEIYKDCLGDQLKTFAEIKAKIFIDSLSIHQVRFTTRFKLHYQTIWLFENVEKCKEIISAFEKFSF